MRLLRACSVFWLLLLAVSATVSAGTPGSFRGTIVEPPQAPPGKNWIYVQGRNGTARRVEISRARVIYDENVPAASRRSNPADALTAGTEIRVTAEQGSDGEWRASRIEILKAAVSTQQSTLNTQKSAPGSKQAPQLSPSARDAYAQLAGGLGHLRADC